MPDKTNPFGDPPESWQQLQRRLATQREMKNALEQQQQAELARQQSLQRAVLIEALSEGPQGIPLGSPPVQGFLDRFEARGDPLPEYQKQLAANRERLLRLMDAQQAGRTAPEPDRTAELARQAISKALSAAVDSGLIDEQRALAMIAAGRINDQPFDPTEVMVQLEATLGQALAAGAITSRQASAALAAVGTVRSPSSAPVDPERAALIAQLDRLEELLYDAMTILPCHTSEHAGLHREEAFPCPNQAARVVRLLVAALDLPPSALPRALHRAPGGALDPCCATDGNVGTWLAYGQTRDPGVATAPLRPVV